MYELSHVSNKKKIQISNKSGNFIHIHIINKAVRTENIFGFNNC